MLWHLHRSAIIFGTAIPLALFLVWNGVILGTITTLGTEADKIADPLQLLRSTSGIVGVGTYFDDILYFFIELLS